MSNPVAGRYSLSAETYETLWSPVIRPMAHPLLDAIAPVDGLVVDVGCGVGALVADLSARMPSARIVGVDASEGMLRRAPAPVACADATALPLPGRVASAAIAIFMLHHVASAAGALAEMARIVRSGGAVATATWAADAAHEAGEVWDALLDEAGATSPPPVPDYREAVDEPEKIAALLAAAGLPVVRAWKATAAHHFTPDELVVLHTDYGRRNERFVSLSADARPGVVAAFRARIDADPSLLWWRPTVVYALARRA